MDKKSYLKLIFALFVYFFLRVIYPSTIEFGYDQPRLATKVSEYISSGSFITSQYYYMPASWGNVSNGPALIYIYLPILLISRNPLVISYLSIVLNSLSVVILFLIGKRFFSERVGFISALILATHPWWVIFSRMIYNPTPLPLLVSLLMFSIFKVFENPKSKWIIVLLTLLPLLFQVHSISTPIIIVTLIYLILLFKRISKLYLITGLLIDVLLFMPSVHFFLNNPDIFYNYFNIPSKYTTTFLESTEGFVKYMSGLGLKPQLGYSLNFFLDKYPIIKYGQKIIPVLVISLIIVSFAKSVFNKSIFKDLKINYLFFLLITPLWFLPIVGVEIVLPRYFLINLPSMALILSVLLDDKKFLSLIFIIMPFWVYLILNYYSFISSFNYSNGFLSNWSDVPFTYLDKSFKWILEDVQENRYDSFTISSDPSSPFEFMLNDAQRYYWTYVLKKDFNLSGNVGHYLMYYSPVSRMFTNYDVQFGPYIITSQPNLAY